MSTIKRTTLALSIALVVGSSLPTTARAATPQDQGLGTWKDVCVVQREYHDETITFASDETWADQECVRWLSNDQQGNASPWVIFPHDQSSPTGYNRPGLIVCAFVFTYSGAWQELTPSSGAYSGSAQITIRDTGGNYYGAHDCASLRSWAFVQNVKSGAPSTGGNRGGEGGGGAGPMPITTPPRKAQRVTHKKQPPKHHH